MSNSGAGTSSRDEHGRYAPDVKETQLLEAVEELEPAGTSEVADAVDLRRQSVDYRLRRLADAGRVEKKKVGGSLIWSLPSGGGGGGEPVDEPPVREHNAARARESTGPSLRDRVEGLDIPGSGSRLEDRREALVAVLEHLRERGQATARELKDVLDQYPHGYESAESFWSNLRTKNALAELEVVETPGQGGKLYRYREPEGGEDRGVA